jgi:transposase-like protein
VAGEPYCATRGRLVCRSCRHQATPTAGTIFDKTRTPLTTWFGALWYVTNQKHGVSALGLQRVLGLGSYQTAWAMLHKLRRAMVRPGRDRLAGLVEVDESYVGGEEPGAHGRQTHKKAIVALAVEVHEPRGFGRARLRKVPDVSGASLVPFVCEAVEPGSQVHTDGWGGYNALSEHGYVHRKTIVSSSGDPAHVSMPAVHRVAALLKRWLLGTHQGAVGNVQLDYYLDEFTFRFNRRSSRSRGLLFYRLLEQAAVTTPMPYRSIVGGQRRAAPNNS